MTGITDRPAIECRGLTKDYGGGHGVFDLDLEVARGEVVGFVGPNGAGKTTTIRLVMDLIRPDRGAARVLGLDSRRDSLAIKRRVGYLPGELPQFPGVRAGQVIALLGNLRGGIPWARVRELAALLELDLDRRYQELSHGNKQKVGLIQAFMHDPEVLILDEPTLGLDPLMQRAFRGLIEDAAARGAGVLLSSHVLAELEAACDRIGLIRQGRLLRVGTLAELRSVRTHRVTAVLPEHVDTTSLAAIPGVSDIELDGDRFACRVHGPMGRFVRWLADANVLEFDSAELSLEEVFLAEFDST
jgi:ABC-2 type transport system ATP-binding protein